MKKLAITLAAALTIALTGCGSSSSPIVTYVAHSSSQLQLFKINESSKQATAVSIQIPSGAEYIASNSDATAVAYTRDGDNGWDIFTMGTDSVEKELTTGADAWGPAFSPSGKTVAYVSYQSGDNQIYTMAADGSNQTPLFAAAGVEEYYPEFSPDGKSLVFFVSVDCKCDKDQRQAMHAGRSWKPTPHATKPQTVRRPTAQVVQITQNGFYRMALTDSVPTLIYATNEAWGPAVFSGDGNKILFTMYDGQQDNIFSVSLDGSSLTPLTTSTDTDNFSPVPYKNLILFNRWDSDNSSWDIYVMDQSGSNQALIHSTASTDESLIDTYYWED